MDKHSGFTYAADAASASSRHSTKLVAMSFISRFSVRSSPLSSNGITKVLNRIGRKHRGKPFGSSILRHSYLSHKYGKVNEDKEKDADIMGHSVSTQTDYVKKD